MSAKPPPVQTAPPIPITAVMLLAAVAVGLAIALSRPAPAPRAEAAPRHPELRAPQWARGEVVINAKTGRRMIWGGGP
jgi:hypothetical protein